MSKVHVFLNLKGGVGKTTLVGNLAATVAKILRTSDKKLPVLVVSTDPQGSLIAWADRSEDCPFDYIHETDPAELENLRAAKKNYQHVFIDTPGHLRWENEHLIKDDALLQKTLSLGDSFYVPITVDPLSHEPTAITVERIIRPENKPYKVIINNWEPRDGASDLEDLQKEISSQGWPLANTTIRHYRIHARAPKVGLFVTQYKPNAMTAKCKEDFTHLAIELGIGGGL